jgi:hypothetical protein
MHFIGQEAHLESSEYGFIKKGKEVLGATPNHVKSWVRVIKVNYLPR